MSVPLPPYRSFTEETSGSTHVRDIFLDADERYEIYEVKSAERYHLLSYNGDDDDDDDVCEYGFSEKEEKVEYSDNSNGNGNGNGNNMPKPLIDGCDIPGWRKEKLVATYISPDQQAILNIGASSTMFRRERQWPNIHMSKDEDSAWNAMRQKLNSSSNIRRRADIIQHDECRKLVPVLTKEGDKDIHIISGSTSGCKMVTKFAMQYEQQNIPAIILGATIGWKCMPSFSNSISSSGDWNMFSGGGVGGWTFSNLLSRFRHVYWRFSDTHGEMMSFGTYAKYITNLEGGLLDDSPLGIYDSEFGDDDSPTRELLQEYDVPSCFSPDLFDLATDVTDMESKCDGDGDGESSSSHDSDGSCSAGTRPPYRWILIGPERSGTGMHIDPLWTNAWVTVLQGKKRWMLFPPSVPLEEIGMIEGEPQINSATWFKIYYDKVIADDWPEEWRPVEVLQTPGETVFVPNGWPHLVLNLELTVAVTHNYASEFGPFERMWEEVSRDEPDFAARWLDGMRHDRPDLVERLKKHLDVSLG